MDARPRLDRRVGAARRASRPGFSRRGVVAARAVVGAALLGAACVWSPGAGAADAGGPYVYRCTTGKVVRTSDREFIDCEGEQTKTDRVGAVVVLPTPRQALEMAECEKVLAELVATWRARQHYENNLRNKYPDAAALGRAREAALEEPRARQLQAQRRLIDLDKERQRLMLEKEFYPNLPLPPELARGIGNNDASIGAQNLLLRGAQDELARTGAKFDALQVEMKTLWTSSGAPRPERDCSVAGVARKAAAPAAPRQRTGR